MKKSRKIRIFALVTAILTILGSVSAFAEDKALDGSQLSFSERAGYALQGTVTGLLMVFAVLSLLWGVVSVSKVIFYTIPKKKAESERQKTIKSSAVAEQENVAPVQVAPADTEANGTTDDSELAAVITAAIAAMLESEEYKNEFVGGFRVVSFKRSTQGAWNRK